MGDPPQYVDFSMALKDDSLKSERDHLPARPKAPQHYSFTSRSHRSMNSRSETSKSSSIRSGSQNSYESTESGSHDSSSYTSNSYSSNSDSEYTGTRTSSVADDEELTLSIATQSVKSKGSSFPSTTASRIQTTAHPWARGNAGDDSIATESQDKARRPRRQWGSSDSVTRRSNSSVVEESGGERIPPPPPTGLSRGRSFDRLDLSIQSTESGTRHSSSRQQGQAVHSGEYSFTTGDHEFSRPKSTSPTRKDKMTAIGAISSIFGIVPKDQPEDDLYARGPKVEKKPPAMIEKGKSITSMFRLQEEQVADDFEHTKVAKGIETARKVNKPKQKTSYEVDAPRISITGVQPDFQVRGMRRDSRASRPKVGQQLDERASDDGSDSSASIDILDELLHPEVVQEKQRQPPKAPIEALHESVLSGDDPNAEEAENSNSLFRLETSAEYIREEAEEQLNDLDHAEAVINTFNEILEQSELEKQQWEAAMNASVPSLVSMKSDGSDEEDNVALRDFIGGLMKAIDKNLNKPPKKSLTDLFRWTDKKNVDYMEQVTRRRTTQAEAATESPTRTGKDSKLAVSDAAENLDTPLSATGTNDNGWDPLDSAVAKSKLPTIGSGQYLGLKFPPSDDTKQKREIKSPFQDSFRSNNSRSRGQDLDDTPQPPPLNHGEEAERSTRNREAVPLDRKPDQVLTYNEHSTNLKKSVFVEAGLQPIAKGKEIQLSITPEEVLAALNGSKSRQVKPINDGGRRKSSKSSRQRDESEKEKKKKKRKKKTSSRKDKKKCGNDGSVASETDTGSVRSSRAKSSQEDVKSLEKRNLEASVSSMPRMEKGEKSTLESSARTSEQCLDPTILEGHVPSSERMKKINCSAAENVLCGDLLANSTTVEARGRTTTPIDHTEANRTQTKPALLKENSSRSSVKDSKNQRRRRSTTSSDDILLGGANIHESSMDIGESSTLGRSKSHSLLLGKESNPLPPYLKNGVIRKKLSKSRSPTAHRRRPEDSSRDSDDDSIEFHKPVFRKAPSRRAINSRSVSPQESRPPKSQQGARPTSVPRNRESRDQNLLMKQMSKQRQSIDG